MQKNNFNGWRLFTNSFETAIQVLKAIDLTSNYYKKKNNRSVYKVDLLNHTYFIKKNFNKSFIEKIQYLFHNKSKDEFYTLTKLIELKIDCVKPIAYATCKWQDFLITEAPEIAYLNAREYLLLSILGKGESINPFVNSLIEFLKKVIECNIVHPDFHFGNLLYSKIDENSSKFIIVDPYGVKIKKNKQTIFESGVANLVSQLRNHLTEEQKNELFTRILNCSAVESKNYWEEVSQNANNEIKKIWNNRVDKIMSGKSRFCNILEIDDVKTFIKKNIFGENPFENSPNIEGEFNKYKRIELSYNDAVYLFLLSFFLQFHELDHLQIIACSLTNNGNAKIYIENCNNFPLLKNDDILVINFVKNMEKSNIFLNNDLKKFVLKNNRCHICISDINDLKLPTFFYARVKIFHTKYNMKTGTV